MKRCGPDDARRGARHAAVKTQLKRRRQKAEYESETEARNKEKPDQLQSGESLFLLTEYRRILAKSRKKTEGHNTTSPVLCANVNTNSYFMQEERKDIRIFL